MNKIVNLDSFYHIYKTENQELLASFIRLKDYGCYDDKSKIMTEEEFEGIARLYSKLKEVLNDSQKNGFQLNVSLIAGIKEQFDILRFSEDFILNIELKSQIPDDGLIEIKNQLLRHRYLLRLLNKEVAAFTYVNSIDKLYHLDNYTNELIEADVEVLVANIKNNYIIENLLEKIDQSEIIISPYSQPKKFIEHEYYLTEEQHKVCKEILASDSKKFGLIGGPGTGKSLVLIDLAKKYIRSNKTVLIIFCAPIPEADLITNTINIKIIGVKDMNRNILLQYDIIMIDEAQRLYEFQFNELKKMEDKIVIFSADHKQTLHRQEKYLHIENKLKEDETIAVQTLKDKVRTDEPLSSFIQKFLNLKAKGLQPYHYNKVDVVYFSDNISAELFIEDMYTNKNFIPIELTEYRTRQTGSLKRKNIFYLSKSTHEVIGREYDNVLVPLDKHFGYSKDARLVSNYSSYYPYIEDSCIFEALSRVKEKLLLVIIDNPRLFNTVQEIITWKIDTEERRKKKCE